MLLPVIEGKEKRASKWHPQNTIDASGIRSWDCATEYSYLHDLE